MLLTSDDVRAVEFRTPRWSGAYATGEVDAFLDRVCVRLDTGAGLTASEVDAVVFRRSRRGRGHDGDAVDALLDRLERQLAGRRRD